eukprot:scaffold11440_cov136-Isochrysis_galbana.AAC.6
MSGVKTSHSMGGARADRAPSKSNWHNSRRIIEKAGFYPEKRVGLRLATAGWKWWWVHVHAWWCLVGAVSSGE